MNEQAQKEECGKLHTPMATAAGYKCRMEKGHAGPCHFTIERVSKSKEN